MPFQLLLATLRVDGRDPVAQRDVVPAQQVARIDRLGREPDHGDVAM